MNSIYIQLVQSCKLIQSDKATERKVILIKFF